MQSYSKAIPEERAPEHDAILNSDHWNYRMAIGNITVRDQELFDAILATSRELNCTLEQAMQEAIQVRLHDPKAIPETHKSLYRLAISSEAMGEAVSKKDWSRFSARFWEHFYERVRVKLAPRAPPRLQSLFACLSIEDVHAYLQLPSVYRGSSQVLFEIIPVDLQVEFRADGTFIEEADSNCTFNEAAKLVHLYWAKQKTRVPQTEVLLQGSFRVKRLDISAR